MISITGQWYDSKTSAQVGAVCRIYDNGVVQVERLEDGASLVSLPRFDIKVSPRLADTPRSLYFSGGEKFETQDNDAVDRVMNQFKRHSWLRFVHLMESRKRYALLALAILLLSLWGAMKYGVPAAAKLIAFRLPPSVDDIASRHTLDILDRTLLRPSELDEATQTRIVDRFQPVIRDHPGYRLKILFRKGNRLGPNAFALPDGTIIFTDEMVALSEHDDGLAGVLAHEIGHVVHRHGMRTVVQDSLLGFAFLAITGDASGSSELFLAFPVLLTQLAYSREFEREADRYALNYLRSSGIPTTHFAKLIRRIDQKMVAKSETSDDKWLDYLSTHPMTEERLKDFEQ
ncbi:MAG: M48 family metallopeptidase [Deltaproteobacteria bacterium]|nr:M48 family metallopeptidase [Deltaproteobacteria bacterium]MBW2260045.1 M48 family metallopeptidase [Deltaproteobacteria bacterium]